MSDSRIDPHERMPTTADGSSPIQAWVRWVIVTVGLLLLLVLVSPSFGVEHGPGRHSSATGTSIDGHFELFVQRGVRLTSQQVDRVRASSGQRLSVTSNGRPVLGKPADLQLEPDQQTVLSLR